MEDEKIVALYFERDESAIRETAMKYGSYCYRVAYNILHSHEDSEECLNDTWNGAWNAIPPEKPTRLKCFLARITRNIAIDRYRHENAEMREGGLNGILDEYAECIPSGDAPIEDTVALKQAINTFLAHLDARTRVIFMRRYFYAMSVKEIAEGLRLSESYVSVLLHRTRSKFKDHLTKEGIFV